MKTTSVTPASNHHLFSLGMEHDTVRGLGQNAATMDLGHLQQFLRLSLVGNPLTPPPPGADTGRLIQKQQAQALLMFLDSAVSVLYCLKAESHYEQFIFESLREK